MKNNFEFSALLETFNGGLLCWEEKGADNFSVRLKTSRYLEFEGSLTLSFYVNTTEIYNLYFNFAPGNVLGNIDDTVVFVSGLKGVKNESSNITLATKYFVSISPQLILMKIVEAIALSQGLNTIVAINARNQVSFNSQRNSERFYIAYDEFWEKLGGIMSKKHFYFYFGCPYAEKPLNLIKSKYRARVILKRKRMKALLSKAVSNLSPYIQKV